MMTNRQATRDNDGDHLARCACGLTSPGPWELTEHFLSIYPPNADRPPDDIPHADVTRLAVKLDEGPSEAWEAGTWARDPRRHLRVAASVATALPADYSTMSRRVRSADLAAQKGQFCATCRLFPDAAR
jgi:hypothetical protein